MPGFFCRTAAVAALLCSSAVGSPVPEPSGYWTGPAKGPVPATLSGGKVIRAKEIEALLEQTAVVLVDVDSAPRRPPQLAPNSPWLPLPHESIPGSIWIPGAGLGEIPDSIDAYFRERLVQATGNNKSRPLVIFCHEQCWLSWNAAKRAIGYGYGNVYWFPEGIEGWRAAGLPVAVIEPEPVPD
jgi:PQQ-dependent catabolism-associated CXXCW motif protein